MLSTGVRNRLWKELQAKKMPATDQKQVIPHLRYMLSTANITLL